MLLRALEAQSPGDHGSSLAPSGRPRRTMELLSFRAMAPLARMPVILAVVMLVAGSQGGAAAEEAPKAGLVIQFDADRIEARCLAIDADGSTGADLLAQSGLEVIMDASSGMGVTVCRIENLGCNYPSQPCFCQCMTGSQCTYWNYFYREPGQPDWVYSPLGAKLRHLQPGVVEAWVWGDGRTPPPDKLTFEAVCGAPRATETPTPASPAGREPDSSLGEPTTQPVTSQPAGSTADSAKGQAPTQSLKAPDPEEATLPTISPTPMETATTDPSRSSYWPFGLMVLALVALGVYLGRRRTGGV